MPKAPYNTTMDVIYGPNSSVGTPGVAYAVGVPCRLVPYDDITPISSVTFLETAWVTCDNPIANVFDVAIVSPGVLSCDYYAADQIAIPSGGPATHYVTEVEQVSRIHGSAYFRYRVVPLPYLF